MSTQALVTIDPVQALAVGGVGLGSDLFKLRPATIEIVQRTTRQEGAIPGKLRITQTNEHFEEMQVAMLFPPAEQMACFEGEEFTIDSKICFSLDCDKPHDKARVPQAMACSTRDKLGRRVFICPKASWEKYRQTKKREDLPKCRNYYHLVLADRATQMPYYFNVRGKSIDPFKEAMQNVARLIAKMQAAGEKPNIFDVSFKIYAIPVKDTKGVYYVPGFKEFAPIKKEDRQLFGNLFLDFVSRRAAGNVVDAAESEAEPVAASTAPMAEVVSVETNMAEPPANADGTITI